MKNCLICGVEHNKRSDYCSQKCYFKAYYEENKERLNAKKSLRFKETYIPHPRPLKSEEEKKERIKKYKEEHKEEIREWYRAYYQKKKNDPHYKQIVKEAQKRYFDKKRAEKKVNTNDKSE